VFWSSGRPTWPCMEELGFRGYPLRTLVPGLGLWPAQAIVAVAFSLCHLAFGWSWTTILLGVIPSALLFGMAAIASRGLAVPIGLHAGVNLAQSSMSGNSSWGFWKLAMDDQARGRITALSPISGVAVTVGVMLGFGGGTDHTRSIPNRRQHRQSCAVERVLEVIGVAALRVGSVTSVLVGVNGSRVQGRYIHETVLLVALLCSSSLADLAPRLFSHWTNCGAAGRPGFSSTGYIGFRGVEERMALLPGHRCSDLLESRS
jgi:Type II CAAX prenyl endopeptidase Rce1-like